MFLIVLIFGTHEDTGDDKQGKADIPGDGEPIEPTAG
jgi:hypothetical protein